MSKKIKIGVIGLGRIGWSYHCFEIARNKNYELVAVADNEPTRLEDAEKEFSCSTYTDYRKLLKHPGLEAVVIASPTHLHKKMAVDSFKHRLHVIMEKPLATNIKEAKEIKTAAQKARKLLTTYQPHRLRAYFQHAKDLIEKKVVGEVYHIRFGRYRFVRRNDWQALLKFSGGQLNNTGAHVLDQVVSLLGPKIKDVFCQMRLVAALGDAEDVVKILCRNEKGLLAEVDINQATLHEDFLMEIIGTKGVIYLPDMNHIHIKTLVSKSLKKKSLDASMASAGRKYPSDSYQVKEKKLAVNKKYELDFYQNIYEAIHKRKKLYIQPEETIAVMELINQCKKDANKIINSQTKY